jgi:general secretion pathway protein I
LRADAGFTLLEVMIAFAIAALALGAFYSGVAGGVRTSGVAAHYEAALARAQSRLATIGGGARLIPGETSGDDGGGYTWRVQIRQTASAPFAGLPPDAARIAPRAALFALNVTIAWNMDGGERRVTLGTARLLGIPAAAP